MRVRFIELHDTWQSLIGADCGWYANAAAGRRTRSLSAAVSRVDDNRTVAAEALARVLYARHGHIEGAAHDRAVLLSHRGRALGGSHGQQAVWSHNSMNQPPRPKQALCLLTIVAIVDVATENVGHLAGDLGRHSPRQS